jgi:hypothetical protein
MCCYIYIIASTSVFFNLLAKILKLLHFCIHYIHSMFWGGVVVFGLKLDKCMCQQGGEVSTHYVTRGEIFRKGGETSNSTQSWEHSFERDCTCSGEVAFELFLLDVLSLCLSWWV